MTEKQRFFQFSEQWCAIHYVLKTEILSERIYEQYNDV